MGKLYIDHTKSIVLSIFLFAWLTMGSARTFAAIDPAWASCTDTTPILAGEDLKNPALRAGEMDCFAVWISDPGIFTIDARTRDAFAAAPLLVFLGRDHEPGAADGVVEVRRTISSHVLLVTAPGLYAFGISAAEALSGYELRTDLLAASTWTITTASWKNGEDDEEEGDDEPIILLLTSPPGDVAHGLVGALAPELYVLPVGRRDEDREPRNR